MRSLTARRRADKTEPLDRAENAVKMIGVIMDMMKLVKQQDRVFFVNNIDPELRCTAAQLLASKLNKQVMAQLTGTTDEYTSWRRDYYHRFLTVTICSPVPFSHPSGTHAHAQRCAVRACWRSKCPSPTAMLRTTR
jgi:hypothetical protein